MQDGARARETVESCLQQVVRVTLTDGRTIQGVLQCYDNEGNLIVTDAVETWRRVARRRRAIRLGTVLVPGGATVRVLVCVAPKVAVTRAQDMEEEERRERAAGVQQAC